MDIHVLHLGMSRSNQNRIYFLMINNVILLKTGVDNVYYNFTFALC